MKNNFIKTLALTLCVILSAIWLSACSGYEVSLPIGDGNVENDNVNCEYKIAEKFTDGYELKGTFSYESEANLDGEFVLSITIGDSRATDIKETVLYSFNGEDLKNADGGKINFSVKLEKLSAIFPETSEAKQFNINFHRKDKTAWDITDWNSSSYEYVFDGKTLKITK